MDRLKCIFIFLIGVLILSSAGTGYGAEFYVSDATGLKMALSASDSNGEDDVIYLDAGTYSGGFAYYAGKFENKSLTLSAKSGLTAQDVILDGGGTDRVLLFIDVYASSDCTISNITVQNGDGWFSGGLDLSTDGQIQVSNCILKNNTSNRGGGIYAGGSKIILENNVITSNTASNGGGIYTNGGTVQISGNTISGNTVTGDGGAIAAGGAPIDIYNNVITNNSSVRGGGVYAFQAGDTTLTLMNNTITDNDASNGGGVYSEVGSSVFVNNVIAGNEASLDCGGLYARSYGGSITLTNNTISANQADDDAGGVSIIVTTESASASVYNNIIWNNTAVGLGQDILLSGEGNKNGYNNDYTYMTGTWTSSADNIDADPLFVAPASNDFHLTVDSPCIDAGNNDAPYLTYTDKDGNIRIVDGDGNGTSLVDIGAYEYVPGSSVRSTVIPDVKVNGSDGPLTITQGDRVLMTVSLDPGQLAGQEATWWLTGWTPMGWISYHSLRASWYWVLGLTQTYQGYLFTVNSLQVMDHDIFPVGQYVFMFGIDADGDGSMDYYDTISLTVTGSSGNQGSAVSNTLNRLLSPR